MRKIKTKKSKHLTILRIILFNMSNIYAFIPPSAKDIITVPITEIITHKGDFINKVILEELLIRHSSILYYVGDLVNFREEEFISLLDDTFEKFTPTVYRKFTRDVSDQLQEYHLGFLGQIKDWKRIRREEEIRNHYYEPF